MPTGYQYFNENKEIPCLDKEASALDNARVGIIPLCSKLLLNLYRA